MAEYRNAPDRRGWIVAAFVAAIIVAAIVVYFAAYGGSGSGSGSGTGGGYAFVALGSGSLSSLLRRSRR